LKYSLQIFCDDFFGLIPSSNCSEIIGLRSHLFGHEIQKYLFLLRRLVLHQRIERILFWFEEIK